MYTMNEYLILASGSPRRSEMLTACGIQYKKIVSDVDEAILPNESPKAMVERLASAKAKAVADSHRGSWVLGADTTVVINGRILGKPSSKDEAFEFLKLLQGSSHEVWGGISLLHLESNRSYVLSSCSKVTMRPLSDQSIRRYIESGEPMDKAGAYAIQGIGASLVQSVEGSYTNVVGMDLCAVISTLIDCSIIRVES